MNSAIREYRVIREDVRPREIRYAIHLVYINRETGFMTASVSPERVARYAPDWEDVKNPNKEMGVVLDQMREALSKPMLHWVQSRLEECEL